MTTAVLVVTQERTDHQGPAALLSLDGVPLVVRLASQLRATGCEVVVLTRLALVETCASAFLEAGVQAEVRAVDGAFAVLSEIAREADRADGALLVAHGEVVVHARALEGILREPQITCGALSARWTPEGEGAGVRYERGRAVSAASSFHRVSAPTHRFLSVLKTDRERAPLVAAAAREAAAFARAHEVEDAVALLLVALVRSDVVIRNYLLHQLRWARPLSAEAAAAAERSLAEVDEERVKLRSAVKPEDGAFTTFFVSPYSKHIARWAARAGLSPNQVTIVSMIVGLFAAGAFAIGTRAGLVAGAILLQVAFTLDCVDGQLARYTLQFSGLGAWLDSVFDRAKEYAVFAGLAFGATRARADRSIWLLAGSALALQTVRHLLDFGYASTQHEQIATVKRVALDVPDDAVEDPATSRAASTAPSARVGTAVVRASARLDKRPWVKYVKRFVILPIGERFAAISIAAAFGGPRLVFILLLVWGSIAGLYSGTGRVLRSIAR